MHVLSIPEVLEVFGRCLSRTRTEQRLPGASLGSQLDPSGAPQDTGAHLESLSLLEQLEVLI